MGPDEFFTSNADQMYLLTRAMPGLRAMEAMTRDLPHDSPERAQLRMMSVGSSVLDAVMQRRWTDAEDRSLADLQREIDRAAGAGTAEVKLIGFRFLAAMARAYRCLYLASRPGSRPSAAEIEEVIADLEAGLEAVSGPLERAEPGNAMGASAGPARWIVGCLLIELAMARSTKRGGSGGLSRDEETRLLARAREYLAGVSLADLPLSADTVAMMNHFVAQLPAADPTVPRTDPGPGAPGPHRPRAPRPDAEPAASGPRADAGRPGESRAEASSFRPDELDAQETSVRRLRELFAAADGGDRGQASLLLGLAIADLVSQLPDGDPRLSELVDEGRLRLAEPAIGEQPPAMAAAVDRSRTLLDGRLAVDPGEIDAASPDGGADSPDPAGPRVAVQMPVSFSVEGPDPNWNIDWDSVRRASEWSRDAVDLLRFVGPDLPVELQSMSRLAIQMQNALDDSAPGAKERAGEAALAGMRQFVADPGMAGQDGAPAAMFTAMLMILRVRECMTAEQAGEPADWPEATELDDLILDVAEGEDPLSGMGPALGGLVGMKSFVLAGLIMSRIVLDLRGGIIDREPSWYDDTIHRLRRARESLATPPPALASLVEPLRDNTIRMIGALELARDAAAHRRAAGIRGGSPPPAPTSRPTPPPTPDLSPTPDPVPTPTPPSVPPLPAPAPDHQDAGGIAAALLDEVGGGFPQARAMAQAAAASQDPDDLAAAVDALRSVRRGLPAGHPEHATVLVHLAHALGLRARLTGSPQLRADALDAAVEAVRASRGGGVRAAARLLRGLLVSAVIDKHTGGPFAQAEAALRAARTAADPADAHLMVTLSVGIGAAGGLQARAGGGGDVPLSARQALTDVEGLLPSQNLTADWYEPAREVFTWAVSEAVTHRDLEAAAVAMRVAGRMEELLAADPTLAERASGGGPDGDGVPDLLDTNDGRDEIEGLRLTKDVLKMLLDGGSLAEEFYRSVARSRSRRPAASPAAQPGPFRPTSGLGEDSGLFAHRGLELAAEIFGDRQPDSGARRPTSHRDRPRPELLRAATADLHAALAGALPDSELRTEVDGTLGRCLAELYRQAVADPSAVAGLCAAQAADGTADVHAGYPGVDRALARTLLDAVEHISRSLSVSAHAEPSVARADLMDVLARCYRELYERAIRPDAWLDAQRTAEAAVRELARCVLISDDPARAMDAAARANETVARAVGWCLADRRYDGAVRIAEAGRSLVLSSVVIAGRVEAVLRGGGRDDLADGWRRGDAPGRLAGLNGLWDIEHNGLPLSTPSADEIRVMLAATTLDAVVYLVPPASSDDTDYVGGEQGAAGRGRLSSIAPCRAIVLRPLSKETVVIDLPGVRTGPGTPIARYLAAFDRAVKDFDDRARYTGGFRGSPSGRLWADELEELGRWAHTHIVGPLVEHTRGWALPWDPRIALIPLGELAAVPYAAAWTPDPAIAGGRRYTIHDLVLTHAASSRLLIQTALRPRQDLTERVVFVVDPTGRAPYGRFTAKQLVERQYPQAELRGRATAPNGPATGAAVLGALPQDDQAGASLLHLYTHGGFLADDSGTGTPTAALRTFDGWLPLTKILDQARNRPPDAAGGLVVTNVCMTDSTRVHFDESVTLATAILAAGATGVVATRWLVDDDTGSVLTFRLHYHLQTGHRPADALRRAQLDLLAPGPNVRKGLQTHLAALPESRLSHPASWAAYVFHGV